MKPPLKQPGSASALDADLAGKVHRVFTSPDGAPILERLREMAYDRAKDTDQPWRVIGRQDVLVFIDELMKEHQGG